LSIQALIEEVECADLNGAHPKLCFVNLWGVDSTFPNIYADPLMIMPIALILGMVGEDSKLPVSAEISFDAEGKATAPAGWQVDQFYSVDLTPEPDVVVKGEGHDLMLVPYLRLCLKWGGFPGWERYSNPPMEEIAFLTKDLTPF
jgi:hypothetical protein